MKLLFPCPTVEYANGLAGVMDICRKDGWIKIICIFSICMLFLIQTVYVHADQISPSQVPLVEHSSASQKSYPEIVEAKDSEKFDEDWGKDLFFEEEIEPIADPIEPFNRAMFKINDKLYYYFLKPVSKIFSFVLPKDLRVALGRAMNNSKTPISFTNCLLQGRLKDGGTEIARLVINTTFGLGGLFDPARNWWDIRAKKADFGQTMGHYGISHGFYLVLPLIGPSSARDGIGTFAGYFTLPQNYFITSRDKLTIFSVDIVNYVSINPEEYEDLKRDAFDPYTFFRDAYIQHRAELIKKHR